MVTKNNVLSYFFLIVILQFIGLSLQAQQSKLITGTILTEESIPLGGVTIQLKGETKSTLSDSKGQFSLSIPASQINGILVITHVGYKSENIPLITEKSFYSIVLVSTSKDLNDIVVIGYGTSKRKDLTGSVGSVNMQDLQKTQVPSFDQALAGRVAGVQVSASDGQPGSSLNIVIRGNNSITQSNSPLYVVDGFPIEVNLNTMLNPSDIESVEVLKDASATAIYGARAANGVIMITTKKAKMGNPVVNFQSSLSTQDVIKRIAVLDPYEFVKYQLELNPTLYTPVYLSNGRTIDSYRSIEGVNWQDMLFRKAIMQNHSLSISGGNAQTKYVMSGSLMGQDGVIINGGFNRKTGRIVLDQVINKKAKVGVNLSYTLTKSYGTRVGAATGSPTSTMMYSIWGYRPVAGSDAADASLAEDLYDPNVDPSTDLRFNPYVAATNAFNPTRVKTLLANSYLEYNILPSLKLRITGGMTKMETNSQVFNSSKTQSGNPISSVNGVNGSVTNSHRTNLLNENTLTYTPNLGNDHSLTVLSGLSTQSDNYESAGFTAIQVPNESLGISGLDEGIISKATSVITSNTLVSAMGRVNYNYRSKYYLTASYRADGSSKFSQGNKWSYFPSGSVAWRLINEGFLKNIRFISDAKIRAGFGLTGNNRVSDFAYLSSYVINSSAGYSYNNNPYQGIIPSDLGTRDLKWETTAQTDIGFELGFFQNRVQLTADYYKKNTRDLLLNASIAPSMGYLSGYKNIGKVQNSGFEFTLNTKNIERKNFSWSSSFNIAFNKNKVLELNGKQANMLTSITWGNYSSAPYIAIPGAPIAQFYGYVFDGIYQLSDFDYNGTSYTLKANVPTNGLPRASIQPGYIKYKDLNGDTLVNSSDMTVIGRTTPKHIGGLTNNFNIGNVDVNIFLQWSYGNQLMNVNRLEFEGGEPRNYLNQFATVANRWSSTNPSNTLYKAGGQGPAVYSTRIIEDGSYLRLKSISIGYTLPSSTLKRIGVSTLRMYVAAQNLLTWTKYTGVDPEVSVRNSALTPGFDLSAYPQVKTMTIGINITL